jgi:hypothetical protein
MSRPPGCSFLGARATETQCSVNGMNDFITVIIDSGSDITLISEKVLKKLLKQPQIITGQKISLIQVTGRSIITGYVSLELYFHTTAGPVKIFVEAYVVKGMSADFILGNDFADQYSLSIIRKDGVSKLQLGNTGREVEVRNSISSSLIDENGNAFSVLTRTKSRTSWGRHHKWKSRRRKHSLHDAEVRAAQRVIIPPESMSKVPIILNSPSRIQHLFVERKLHHNTNFEEVYGSTDTLLDAEFPYLLISNFSARPAVIAEGQLLGIGHDADLWLDQKSPKNHTKNRTVKTHARCIQSLIATQSNSLLHPVTAHAICSEASITLKAQCNASEADDPTADPPVEGGPKTDASKGVGSFGRPSCNISQITVPNFSR